MDKQHETTPTRNKLETRAGSSPGFDRGPGPENLGLVCTIDGLLYTLSLTLNSMLACPLACLLTCTITFVLHLICLCTPGWPAALLGTSLSLLVLFVCLVLILRPARPVGVAA